MRYFISIFIGGVLILLYSFRNKDVQQIVNDHNVATVSSDSIKSTSNEIPGDALTMNKASQFVAYAKTLIGTPYLYGSIDPAKGLDCSGFVNAVSNHFGIKVPRSSVEFTNFGITIEATDAKPGDLILFTGTDLQKHFVGHIGIITNNDNGQVEFVHSSSGKANGVTISNLDGYYQSRFVKVIRIFPTNKATV